MNLMYVIKELGRRHHRTLVNILGIGTGVALFVAINAVSGAYRAAARQPFATIGASLIVQRAEKQGPADRAPVSMQGVRLPFSNQLLLPDDLAALQSLEGVTGAASALLLWEFGKQGFRTVLGVDADQPRLGPAKVKDWIVGGRFAQNPGEAAVEKHFAKFQRLKPGDRLAIGGRDFTVVGLVEIKQGAQVAAANIYIPLADAQSLIGAGTRAVNVVYLGLADPSLAERVRAAIGRALPGVGVTGADAFVHLMGGLSRVSDRFALVAGLAALAGALLLILKSMLAGLVERSAEIGILKAVGWTDSDVRGQIMAEVLCQALLGGLLGIALGYLVCLALAQLSITLALPWELNPLPAFAKDPQAASQTVRLPVRVSSGLAATAICLCLAAGTLTAYLAARRTAAMRPADILRRGQ